MTFIWPEALEAMKQAAMLGGNPASVHRLGQKSRRILDEATLALRKLFNAPKAEVIFTGSGEEAKQLAIKGIAKARKLSRIVYALDETLDDSVALVSLVYQNNAAEITAFTEQAVALGIPVHLEVINPRDVDFKALKIDVMSLSAESLGGPQGVGALLTLPGLEIEPLWQGGAQQRGRRSGTEPVALIAGMGQAALCTYRELNNDSKK